MQRYEKGQFVKVRGDIIPTRHAGRTGFVLGRELLTQGDFRVEKYIVCFADQQDELWGVQLGFPTFTVGDMVRVSPILFSDCAGAQGRIIEVQEQGETDHVMEYVVEFNGAIRRQFLAFQLIPFTEDAQAKAS